MLIISWNVAGLKPALQRINSDYAVSDKAKSLGNGASRGGNVFNPAGAEIKSTTKPAEEVSARSPDTSTPSKALTPFLNYLNLHSSPAILCLQEHKIPLSQLSSRSEPHRCSSIEGYESFWSCCTNKQARGFNGVVTYVKKGLVQSANASVLNEFCTVSSTGEAADLDSQGRCIMTDHGIFVLFNVYVPCGSYGAALPQKMKFLNALRKAMAKQREGGKKVILVGDLNLKHDKRDIYWKWRLLNVDDLRRKMRQIDDDAKCGKSVPCAPQWMVDVDTHWDKILEVLQTVEAVPRKTTNPSTGESFDKFFARIKLDNNKSIMLGRYEDSPEEALGPYSFEELTYIDPNMSDCSLPANSDLPSDRNAHDESIVYRKRNLIDVGTLVELMAKVVNISWDEVTQRKISNTNEESGMGLNVGLNVDSPPYLWIKNIMEEDGMVDAFRHYYPDAEARFTCWHQAMNKRYINEGSRIDFTFVDSSLLSFVKKSEDGDIALRCGVERHDNPLGEEAAFMAATANGQFECGSFAGGIATATRSALDSQFSGSPHTGMIYTPPSYSDHIAVSLLLDRALENEIGELILDEKNSSTKKAQPHKKQKSIASFLLAPNSKPPGESPSIISNSSSTSGDKRPLNEQTSLPNKAPKTTLSSYFSNGNVPKSSAKGTKNNGGKNTKPPKKVQGTTKNSILNHFKKR